MKLPNFKEKRTRLWVYATASSGISKIVLTLSNLAQVPIALHYLGAEAFGLWIVLVGMVQFIGFADLGVGLGVQNKVSKLSGNGEFDELDQLWRNGFLLLTAIGAIVCLFGLITIWELPWGRLLNVSDFNLINEVAPALGLLLVAFCVGMPLNLASRFATGLQLGWIVNLSQSVGGLFGLLLVWLGANLGAPFRIFVLVSFAPLILMNLLTWVCLSKITGARLRPVFRILDFQKCKSLLGEGLLFVIPQVSAAVMSFMPSLAIASLSGPAAVIPFNLFQRLTNSLLQFQQMPIGPLWPAYAEAYARKDHIWIQKIFRRSFLYASASGVAGALLIFIFGEKIIGLWTAKSIEFSDTLNFGFAIWFLLVSFAFCVTTLLNGCGLLKRQALASILSAGLLLASLFFAIPYFGASAAIYCMILSWTFVTVPLIIIDIYEINNARA